MSEFEDLRDDVLSAYLILDTRIANRIGDTRRRLLKESRDRLAAGKFYVVVCGEFKRGKSSLLNALVERPGLFPVDVDLATCAVATLQWAGVDHAAVFFASDPGEPDPPPKAVDLERVAEFVTEQGNPGNAKNVLRIEMGAPILQLQSGLVLVDTPGVGSVNPAHTAATKAFLPRADAILFVAAAVEPLGVPELNFLKAALSQCPIVVTAVTMIDKVVNADPVVQEVRARIAAVAGIDPAELVIVPVSAYRKFEAMQDSDPQLLAESGFPELEAELWEGLAVTCGRAQIGVALDAMEDGVAEAKAPVENDLAALRGDAAKVEADLKLMQGQAQKLKASSHGWRRDLQEDAERAARPIQRRLEETLDDIRNEFRQALGTSEALDDPNGLVQRLSDAMVDTANKANSDLETEMGEVADKYAKLTQLSITVTVGGGTSDLDLGIAAPQIARKPVAYSRFREMWMGAAAGAAAGGLIGSFVPFIGNVVGAVVGFIAGLFGGRRHHQRVTEEQQRRTYVADLRDRVLPKLEDARRSIVRDMAEQVRDYTRELTRMLEDEITAKSESLRDSIKLLDETKKRGAKSRADREDELVNLLAELAESSADIDALRARANGLTRTKNGS